MAKKITTSTTIPVAAYVSRLVGQCTLFNSCHASRKKSVTRAMKANESVSFSIVGDELAGQAGLEPATAGFGVRCSTNWSYWPPNPGYYLGSAPYSLISVMVPAPTVRPPSRMANFSPLSIAIGVIKSTLKVMASPGITISIPSGNSTDPVTSVVRK